MSVTAGDVVFYWTRRAGEPSRLIIGRVRRVSADGTLATVFGHDTCVAAHTIATSRLRPLSELPQRKPQRNLEESHGNPMVDKDV